MSLPPSTPIQVMYFGPEIHNVFRKDHVNDTSREGVCLYYKENLLITRGKILKSLTRQQFAKIA